MNHWPDCFDIRHGTSFGHGDSNLFKWSSWGHKRPRPKGT